MSEISGVLCLNKEKGATSHDMINRVRRLFSLRRVGHTGTLDPLATGVLVVMVGRAAKAAEFLSCDKKEYVARMRLGLESDTEDITGNIISEYKGELPTEEEVKAVVSSFVGEISQMPPMYSAIKINGRKLVDLARKNIEVERPLRRITVYSIELEREGDEYILKVCCSSGTYVRTLCADIGRALGCGAVMTELTRTKSGDFSLEGACTLAELEAADESGRLSYLLPTESLFSDLTVVRLPEFFERLARSGLEIYLKKISLSLPVGTRVRLYGADGFFAVGEVKEYPDGNAIKPIKQFVLK